MLATHLGPMPSGGRRGFQDPAPAVQERSGPRPKASSAGPGSAPAEKNGNGAAAGGPTSATGAAGGAAGGNAEADLVDGEAAVDGKTKKSKSRAAKVRSLVAGTLRLCHGSNVCCIGICCPARTSPAFGKLAHVRIRAG